MGGSFQRNGSSLTRVAGPLRSDMKKTEMEKNPVRSGTVKCPVIFLGVDDPLEPEVLDAFKNGPHPVGIVDFHDHLTDAAENFIREGLQDFDLGPLAVEFQKIDLVQVVLLEDQGKGGAGRREGTVSPGEKRISPGASLLVGLYHFPLSLIGGDSEVVHGHVGEIVDADECWYQASGTGVEKRADKFGTAYAKKYEEC